MKLTTRIISAFLVLIMLLSFAACANSEEETQDTTAADIEQTSVIEEKTDVEDSGIEIKDYDKDIVFMTESDAEWSIDEVWVEKDSEDPIESAVFYRNVELADTYGISISTINVEAAQVVSKMGGIYKSSGQDFAAVFCELKEGVSLAQKNYLFDLQTEVPNLDISRSWWDQKAASGLSLGNKLFFATGDIVTTDNDATFILMFNKKIMTDKGILAAVESPASSIYELVNNYEWTFEQMLAMEKFASDQKDKLDPYEDTIGFAMTSNVPYSLLYGAGFISCKKNEDDIPEYGIDGERVSTIVEEAFKIYGDKTLAASMDIGGDGVFENGKKCFGGGHALFFGEVLQCVSRLRGYDVDFGVIPYPTLDASQKAYYTVMNPVGGMVVVPKCLEASNAEISGVALQLMAYLSKYRELTKAYYDISLIAKGTKDEESEPMIDLILANRVYDLGYIFGWSSLVSKLGSCITTGSGTASAIKAADKSFNTAIAKEIKRMKLN